MKIERETLVKVLRQIAPTLGDNKTQIEQLRCFWFDAENKRAWTYDERVATEAPFEGGISGGIANAFLGIIDNSFAPEIDATVSGMELSFKAGSTDGQVSIRGMDEAIYPFPSGDPQAVVELTGGAEAALRHVNFNASDSGVTMVPEDDQLAFYSTDNKSISWARIKLPEGYNAPRLLLSPQFCQRLQVIMEGSSTILEIFDDSVVATVVASSVRLFGRITHEEHPRPFDRAIAAAFTEDDVLSLPPGMADAMKRVRVLVQPGQQSKMNVSLSGGDIHFKFNSTYGKIDEHFAVKGNKRIVDVLFDPEILNAGFLSGAPTNIAITPSAFAILSGDLYGYILQASKP